MSFYRFFCDFLSFCVHFFSRHALAFDSGKSEMAAPVGTRAGFFWFFLLRPFYALFFLSPPDTHPFLGRGREMFGRAEADTSPVRLKVACLRFTIYYSHRRICPE
jgi:hypothetical protein